MLAESVVCVAERVLQVPCGELIIREAPYGERLAFSLVVPTYNESHNLEELVELVMPAIASEVGDSYEIVIVDDDSPDGTWRVARALAEKYPNVVALRRIGERGLATAVVRGWQVSRGELLGVIDADLQHPPEVTAKLIAAMHADVDLAAASRNAHGGGTSDWSLLRLVVSHSLRSLGKLLLPGPLSSVTDPMTGFFVVRRSAVEDLPMSPCGYKILIELLVRSRARRIVEVGYVFRSRRRGASKASFRVLLDYMKHLYRLRLAYRGASCDFNS